MADQLALYGGDPTVPNPPNGLELMELYVKAFRKVMTGVDQIVG